jgi:hypothetical protein
MADTPGMSYKDDTFYRPIEAGLEQKYGLWAGALGGIRTRGERSNANQVSEAGAKSVYQITAATRDAVIARKGVNAYSGPEAAAETAAILLRESLDRNGGEARKAVREYIGGTNPKNWGPVTHAYVARVFGDAPDAAAPAVWKGSTFVAPSTEDLLASSPADIRAGRPAKARAKSEAEIAQQVTAHSPLWDAVAQRGSLTPEAAVGVAQASAQDVAAGEAKAAASRHSLTEVAGAVISKNWLSHQLWRGLDNDEFKADPAFARKFQANIDEYTKDAQSWDEWKELTSEGAMRSEAAYGAAKNKMLEARRRNELAASAGGVANFAAAFADPMGWVGTYGVGKVFQMGRALTAGNAAVKVGIGGRAAEGAAVNLAFTGVADYGGENMSVTDYLSAGAIGAGMGVALHGLSRMGKEAGDKVAEFQYTRAVNKSVATLKDNAIRDLGDAADQAAIDAHVSQQLVKGHNDLIKQVYAPRPDTDRFLPASPEAAVAATQGSKAKKAAANNALAEKHGVAGWADKAEQALAVEIAERSDSMVAGAGDLSKGLEGKLLKAVNGESDALTLLRSGNSVLQGVAIVLAESTTGAGGRKASAAITATMIERELAGALVHSDQGFAMWRQARGIGKLKAAIDPKAREQFDEEVYNEIIERGSRDVANHTDDVAVKLAADAYEQGHARAAVIQKAAQVLGHERLPTSSRGYVTRKLDPRKLLGLSSKQRQGVERELAKQFNTLNEYSYKGKDGEQITKNFDKKFSQTLARDYLQKATDRAQGTTFVPANLHSEEGTQILKDALKAMGGLDAEEKVALLERFSRGGAAFTKGRLNMDLTADIGDGLRLGDLFVKDMDVLYRSYIKRAAGTSALAQYGVYGKPTISMMRRLAVAKGAQPQEIKAFERIMAEFMNEPWKERGQWDHAFQNARNITSAAMLGGMGFAQLAESANAMASLGVRSAISGIAALPAMAGQIRKLRAGATKTDPVLDDLGKLFGHVGVEDFAGNKLFDIRDNGIQLYDQESLGLFSKISRAGVNLNAIASGFRMIHTAQRRALAKQITLKVFSYVKAGANSTAMRDMGLSDNLVATLRAHVDDIAKFDAKGNLTALSLLDSALPPQAMLELQQVVDRGSGQIIQKTFIGETGVWAHNEQLKLMTQFRTFGITSIEKQYGRQVAMHGNVKGAAMAMGIMVGSMSFAIPIHLARVHIATAAMSDSQRKRYLDEHLSPADLGRATLNYTSVLGLLPDAVDIGATLYAQADGDAPDWLKNDLGAHGRVPNLGSYIPALGYANRSIEAVAGLTKVGGRVVGANESPHSARTVVKAMKLLPGASNPLVGAGFASVLAKEEGE